MGKIKSFTKKEKASHTGRNKKSHKKRNSITKKRVSRRKKNLTEK